MSPAVPVAAAEAGVRVTGTLMVLPVMPKLPLLLKVATAAAAAPAAINKTCKLKASVPDPTLVLIAESKAPISTLLADVSHWKARLVPIPAAAVPEVW